VGHVSDERVLALVVDLLGTEVHRKAIPSLSIVGAPTIEQNPQQTALLRVEYKCLDLALLYCSDLQITDSERPRLLQMRRPQQFRFCVPRNVQYQEFAKALRK
jgi:hypothetical protein